MSGSSQNDSVDFVDVLAVVLFLGLGLTSMSLVIWPMSATTYDNDVIGLVAHGLSDEPAGTSELLIAGAALEDLVVEPFPEIEGFDATRVRLIPSDTPPTLLRDRYWVLGLTSRMPDPPEGFASRSIRELETVTLHEWSVTNRTAATSLSDRVRDVDATYVPTGFGEEIPCERWIFGRLFCGPNPWNWVGERESRINGKVERCVWAHPLRDHELRVRFTDVPLSGGVLQGKYGLDDNAVGEKKGSPVTFLVLVDDQERVKRVLPNKKGWNVFTLRAEPDDPETVDLTFVITAPDDAKRHFCFDASLSAPRAKRGGGRP